MERMRPVSACVAPHLVELRERRGARLVEHHVLAVAHGPHRHRRAVGQDAGADDEHDLGIFEDFLLVADALRSRKGLRVSGGEIVLRRVEGFQPAAGVDHDFGLAVDVAVVQADDAEGETGRLSCRQLAVNASARRARRRG